jgi:hypothetical protein
MRASRSTLLIGVRHAPTLGARGVTWVNWVDLALTLTLMNDRSDGGPLKAYLSSTFKDLVDHRDRAYRALRSLNFDVIAMEDYVAADERPVDRCLG